MIRYGNAVYRIAISEEEKKKLFSELAYLQRGAPERAMLQYQMGNAGVMNVLVEHIGDLIHRMTERVTYDTGGYEFVKEKVQRALHYLEDVPAFMNEHDSNLRNNAPYYEMSYEDLKKRANQLLKAYADEHAKLPTYNYVQWLAQEAAVRLGRRDFRGAKQALLELDARLVDFDTWINSAHQFMPVDR